MGERDGTGQFPIGLTPSQGIRLDRFIDSRQGLRKSKKRMIIFGNGWWTIFFLRHCLIMSVSNVVDENVSVRRWPR